MEYSLGGSSTRKAEIYGSRVRTVLTEVVNDSNIQYLNTDDDDEPGSQLYVTQVEHLLLYLCFVFVLFKGFCHGHLPRCLSAGLHHVDSFLQSPGADPDQVPDLRGDDAGAGDHPRRGGGPPAGILRHQGPQQVRPMPAESDHPRK